MRRDRLLFSDILHSIDFILKNIEGVKKEEFIQDELLRSSLFFHLIIIGEATSKISQDIKMAYPHTDWRDIVDFRNFMVHKYFGYDYDTIWSTMINDLPEYRDDIERIIMNEKENI